jgi:hypothetical protein
MRRIAPGAEYDWNWFLDLKRRRPVENKGRTRTRCSSSGTIIENKNFAERHGALQGESQIAPQKKL